MATPNLSEIAATTMRNRSRMLADNVLNNNALLARLKARGKVRPLDGGEIIIQELSFAENSTYKRYSGYEVLNIQPSEVISNAEYDWKQIAVAVTISGAEQMKNSGRSKSLDLLESRLEVAEATMMNGMSNDIYSDGTADGGKQINGLQTLVADSPTTGTVGGIPRATFEFWRNQTTTGTTATNIPSKMEEAWIKQVRGTDKCDLIVSDNTMYSRYWGSLQDQQRFSNTDSARGGFTSLKFNSADVVLDGGFGGLGARHAHVLPELQVYLPAAAQLAQHGAARRRSVRNQPGRDGQADRLDGQHVHVERLAPRPADLGAGHENSIIALSARGRCGG